MLNNWDKYYQETDPEDIPQNKSPDDYLVELLKANKLGKGRALDLGCGVGRKSILLAKNDFEVTGVDISSEAIKQAKENTKKDGVKMKFFSKDRKIYTKGKYEVVEVFNDKEIHFECFDKIGVRK